MPDTTLSILRDTPHLEALRDDWHNLWLHSPDATPFQSPDWLIPWWHHFNHGELRTVALRRSGQFIGLLPCYLYQPADSTPSKLLPLGISTSDYLDCLFAPTCSDADIEQALHPLLEDPTWAELSFPQLRPNSRLCRALQHALPTLHSHPGEATSLIPASPLSNLPPKLRKNINNYRNRAEREGRLDLIQSSASDWEPAFAALCALHSKRWHEAGEPGVLADPHVLAWHREALPHLLATGTARLTTLCLNGQIIAALYSLLDPPTHPERTQYCYLNGISTDYAELSPGTLLLAATVEHAAAEGLHSIDLLRGEEPYKQLWHPTRLATTTLHHHREATPSHSPNPAPLEPAALTLG